MLTEKQAFVDALNDLVERLPFHAVIKAQWVIANKELTAQQWKNATVSLRLCASES